MFASTHLISDQETDYEAGPKPPYQSLGLHALNVESPHPMYEGYYLCACVVVHMFLRPTVHSVPAGGCIQSYTAKSEM